MKPDVYITSYYLEPSIDSIFIRFTKRNNTMDEVDVPEELMFEIQVDRQEENESLFNYMEIINYQEFLKSDFSDTFEANGYNIKQLIYESLKDDEDFEG